MPVPVSNYTQIPNAILDAMSTMGEAEFKVVMAIARKTFGWQKTRDRISLTQLEKMTNLSRQGVVNALEKAQEHGWVVKFETPKGNEWEINVVNDVDQNNIEVVNLVDQKVVNDVDTQKKPIKQNNDNNNEPPIGAFVAHWEKQTATYAAPVIREEIAAWVRAGGTFAYFEECTRAYVTGGGRNWNFMAMILRDGPNKPAPRPATRPPARATGASRTATPVQMTSEERAGRRARALAEAEAQMAAGLAAGVGD